MKGEAKLTKAQQDARHAILRDVLRSGGRDHWSHLHSHGHHFKQVLAAVNRGDLEPLGPYEWRITPAGRNALSAASPTKGDA